jgi:hypothetical protein
MNRHARRAEAAKGAKEPKAKITLHTDPAAVSAEHMAILLTTMSYAFTAGVKIPGVKFPIHIVVEFDGQKVCGTVEPSDGVGESTAVSLMVH